MPELSRARSDFKFGNFLNKFDIGGEAYTRLLNISKGFHIMSFKSLDECIIVDSLIHNKDFRCLSVGIKSIKII